ncbi:MAG TPA: lycopene cyclase domain-containing protein [Chloroflexota bacterium]|nr:lycopene cyclase domain-containing protein [Chloroflexota bacterium]
MSSLGHAAYLLLEVAWAAPVIAVQWLAGPRTLWSSRRLLLAAIGSATAYLSLADAFAIANGIWRINPALSLPRLFGPLPLEEVMFFLVTNAMVAQSIVLIRSDEPRLRLKRLFAHGS